MANPLQAQDKRIGDTVYTVEPLGFTEGRKVFVRLANMLGPALSSIEGKPSSADAEAAMGAVIGKLLQSIREDDLDFLTTVFARRTTVKYEDGKSPILRDVLEAHFSARFADYIPYLVFAVQTTYGDFLVDGMRKVAASLPQASTAQTPSA